MTSQRKPGAAPGRRPPPPPPAEELVDDGGAYDDEFAEAGTLVIEEALQMHAELPEDQGEFAKFLKLIIGNNFLRFLPPPEGKTVPWIYTWQHGWGGGSSYRSINCPQMMAKQRCPICEVRERLLKSGREADQKSAGKLRPKFRAITEVVNLTNDEEAAKGVQLFAYGRKIADALTGILGAGRMGGDFTHKRNGFPIQIVREGTGMDTDYPTISASPNRMPIEGEWLLDRADLSRFTKMPSVEEMKKALEGMGLASAAPADDGYGSSRSTGGGYAARQGLPPAGRRTVADSMRKVYTPPEDEEPAQDDGAGYYADEATEPEPEPEPPKPAGRRQPLPPRRI